MPVVVDDGDARVAAWATRGLRSAIDLASSGCRLGLPDGQDNSVSRIEAFARYCLLHGVDELGYLLEQGSDADRTTSKPQATHEGMRAQIAVLPGDGIGAGSDG